MTYICMFEVVTYGEGNEMQVPDPVVSATAVSYPGCIITVKGKSIQHIASEKAAKGW
jgi:hypothetical protein